MLLLLLSLDARRTSSTQDVHRKKGVRCRPSFGNHSIGSVGSTLAEGEGSLPLHTHTYPHTRRRLRKIVKSFFFSGAHQVPVHNTGSQAGQDQKRKESQQNETKQVQSYWGLHQTAHTHDEFQKEGVRGHFTSVFDRVKIANQTANQNTFSRSPALRNRTQTFSRTHIPHFEVRHYMCTR